MQNKPLLSICIPTYNREKYLKDCLESIFFQDSFDQDLIEIIISDNASIDGTSDLVNVFRKDYVNIKYFRNLENIGMTANIISVIQKATGEYVWVFSDDDLMAIGGLKSMLENIAKYNSDVFINFFHSFIKDNEKENIDVLLYGNECIEFKNFYDFSCYSEFGNSYMFSNCQSFFTYLSNLCFKKEVFEASFDALIQNISPKKISYITTKHFYPHIIILYSFISDTVTLTLNRRILSLYRNGNGSWKFTTQVLMDLISMLYGICKNHRCHRVFYIFSIKMSFIYVTYYLDNRLTPYIKRIGLYKFLRKLFHLFVK